MSATENDWNVLSFVAQHIGAQEDGSIMREEIHLGKLALVVFVAISEFQRLPAEGATLQTYHRISDSYTRYKKKVAQINAMGSCKLLGGATFKELIKEADIVAIFEQGAHAAAQKISSLEAAVLDLLQPALHWKDGFNEETQLEEVVTAGANTIMTVKGKKLHTGLGLAGGTWHPLFLSALHSKLKGQTGQTFVLHGYIWEAAGCSQTI